MYVGFKVILKSKLLTDAEVMGGGGSIPRRNFSRSLKQVLTVPVPKAWKEKGLQINISDLLRCLCSQTSGAWHSQFACLFEELQILTYTGCSWSLSSEESLACHTYCDTRHPFIMVISEDP